MHAREEQLVLKLGSIHVTCPTRLDEAQVEERMELIARDLKQGLRAFGFQERWEGAKKEHLVFTARHGQTDIRGRLDWKRGEAALTVQGKAAVHLAGLHAGFRPNESAVQRLIRDEAAKSLRQAFAERSSISATAAVRYVCESVQALLERELAKSPAPKVAHNKG